jgi:tetratricopeptide (TPR) repeat protein
LSTGASDNEARDAERVNQALTALTAGDLATAESLLLGVIESTPTNYVNSSEDPGGGLSIKFWDQGAFIHHVMWQKQQGREREIRWVGNAYPRAHFYMGFLCVKARRYKQALEYLERGREHFETAQALVHAGEKQRALAQYEAVTEMSPYVSALDIAVAWRGRGFVLIEMGRLDEAEAAFKSSLAIDPDNPVALNELEYIEHLRKGGSISPGEAVPTRAPSVSECAVCGKPLSRGIVVSVKGVPRSVCGGCQRRLTKKWWQFWK